jgi:hypothetical protein
MTPAAEPQPEPDTEPESAQPGPEQPESAQPDQLGPAETTVETEVTVRRIPRYSRFLIIGAGVGAIATFILTASFPSDPSIGFGALFGYFLLFGMPAGALIGAIMAILLDTVLTRRARNGMAERTMVDPLPYDDEPADSEAPESSEETGNR